MSSNSRSASAALDDGFGVIELNQARPAARRAMSPKPSSLPPVQLSPDVARLPARPSITKRLEAEQFDELVIEYDDRYSMLWYHMNPAERPCATVGLMENIRRMQGVVRSAFADWQNGPDGGASEMPLRYLVLASHLPGIFNMGGNLALFAELIERRDRTSLENYARLSIDVIHDNHVNLNLPIVTISLVQGDALGGGFEAALCSNVIVAERSAKFGLPEILFGLFPGMGAYSFLARKIGRIEAERMIFSGKIYSAEELYESGVVDVLAEDGFGEEAVIDYVNRNNHRHSAHRSIYKVRNAVNPVSFAEMQEISRIWVDAALSLEPADLRKMQRLANAQIRRTRAAHS